jgi:hypothetical protein
MKTKETEIERQKDEYEKGCRVEQANIRRIDRGGLAAILLVAIALRGLLIWLRADELTADRDAYLGLARSVAEARGFCVPGSTVATAFRPPLYPLMLGSLMVAVPAGVAVALINGLLGVAAVWATWRASQCLGLGRAGLLGALLVGVDPLLLQYTAQPMTETTCAGLVALMLLAMVSDHWHAARREGTVGALFGLLVLCRPTFLPFAGLMVVVWILERWRDSFVGLRTAELKTENAATNASTSSNPQSEIRNLQSHDADIGKADNKSIRLGHRRGLPWRVAAGTLLVVAPWVIRNQLVFGRPLLTTTHGGYTLLLANNPVFYEEIVDQPWGTVWGGESLARWQAEQDERLEHDLGPRASEIERDARLSAMAREFIASEPRRFVRAVWHRVRSLWSLVPNGDAAGGATRWLIYAVGWYYSLLLLAFAVGMVVVAMRPHRVRWWPLYGLVITVQMVHLVYWTNARMRAPLMPVIALFAVAILAPRGRSVRSNSSTAPADSGLNGSSPIDNQRDQK